MDFLYIFAPIVCFANLKVKVTKYIMLSNRFEFRTHKLCNNNSIKTMHKNSEEKIKFQISPEAKYTNFHEKLQYYFIKKIYDFKTISNTNSVY